MGWSAGTTQTFPSAPSIFRCTFTSTAQMQQQASVMEDPVTNNSLKCWWHSLRHSPIPHCCCFEPETKRGKTKQLKLLSQQSVFFFVGVWAEMIPIEMDEFTFAKNNSPGIIAMIHHDWHVEASESKRRQRSHKTAPNHPSPLSHQLSPEHGYINIFTSTPFHQSFTTFQFDSS